MWLMETVVNLLYILLSLFFLPISDSLRITQGDTVCRGQCSMSTSEERPRGLAALDSASLWGKPGPLWVTATRTWVWPAAPDIRLHGTHNHWKKSTIFLHIKSGTKHPIYLCVLNYRLSEYTSKLSRGNSLLHQPLDRTDCMCERRLNHSVFLNLCCKMDCLWKEANVSVICSQSQTAIK